MDMYNRLTDRMRKVMQLANRAAQEVNRDKVGTEHILLGIIQEGRSISAQILKEDFSVTVKNTRQAVQRISPRPCEGVIVAWLPQTEHVKKLIEIATTISQKRWVNYVGTEHFSLALMSQEQVIKDAKALQVLASVNVSLDKWEEKLLAKLAEDNTPKPVIYLGDN